MNLTSAQRRLLEDMDGPEERLCNGGEGRPYWWLDAGPAVRAQTAKAMILRGFVMLSGHVGGQPGIDYFKISPSGRAALTTQ